MAKSTAIAVVKRETAVLAASLVKQPIRQLADDSVAVGAYVLNFDPATPLGAELLFLSEEKGTRSFDQHLEHPFPLSHWIAKKIELADNETGEVQKMIRLVLISPEKETLDFVSIGAVASLDLIRTLYGDGPFDPPLPLIVKLEKTRSGFNLLRLRPAAGPGADPAK